MQIGRIQDCCHHQVEWEWMTLSQIELVWVIVRVERECFWVNLREDNKVSEFKMAVSESNMADFKMAAIITVHSEWTSEVFQCKMAESKFESRVRDGAASVSSWVRIWEKMNMVPESKMSVSESNLAEFKMAAIIKLSQSEWVKVFCVKAEIKMVEFKMACHHQVQSEWISLSQIGLNWVRVLCNMAECKLTKFKIAAIIKLSENEWVWVRFN